MSFQLGAEADIRLEVYDVLGSRVRTLASGRWAAGRHELAWDGSGDRGARLTPGLYLVRLVVGRWEASRKLVMLE